MASAAEFPQLKRVPLYDAEKEAAPRTVCVTGASSFVAGSIIPRLLAAGHTVHATVRNPGDKRKVAHLEAMGAAAGGRLKLFKADLMEEGSFDDAVRGCAAVIHVASPVNPRVPKGQGRRLLIEPAVRGVQNVLGAVQRCDSVRDVVVTGSIAAVLGNNDERGAQHVYTEADYTQSATDTWLPYNLGKLEAERRAWEMHGAQGGAPRWRLVFVLPSFVVGPPASMDIPAEGLAFARDLLDGKFWPMFPRSAFAFIDIDDLAAAHVLAMVKPEASGRYIVSSEGAFLLDWIRDLRPRFPRRRLPSLPAPRWLLWLVAHLTNLYPWDMVASTYGTVPLMDGSKAERELGLKYHSAKEAFLEELQAVEAARQRAAQAGGA